MTQKALEQESVCDELGVMTGCEHISSFDEVMEGLGVESLNKHQHNPKENISINHVSYFCC